jgi:UDP-N-acetylmuramoylalanine--D-glutamate ligase
MKISVFGAGKSGLAVAQKLRGHDIFLTEHNSFIPEKILKQIKTLKIKYELGGHTMKAIQDKDLIVVSPGVHLDIPILKKARSKKVPIISEIELAYRLLKKPIIAVTGTNGKTTTTALIGQLLKDYGYKVAVAGNIGYPLILVNDNKLDYIVAEISSYQLEAIKEFRPRISIILNITEDHLTRHGTMKEYSRLKARIFENQRKTDHLIYNYDDRIVRRIASKAKCNKVPFSMKIKLRNGLFADSKDIFCNGKLVATHRNMRIKGAHNIGNALASIAAALLCKVSPGSIRSTLDNFKGVEHRIELVRKVKGVTFYNDSKATNPDSTIVAINALKPLHDIVLILGGRDKMTDLSQMCKVIKASVKDVVLVGEARARFRNYLTKYGYRRIHDASTFKDAVKRSYDLAGSGEAVLLSPACASFDMFSNFEERGREFKKIVSSI